MSVAPLSFVLTVIGDDRPGLVEQLSTAISSHGGNWLDSSFSRLAGKFAGILRVEVPAAQAEDLKTALANLTPLKVVVEAAADNAEASRSRCLTLTLVGQDRIGIVREVSQVLARMSVNVEDLATHTASAPMSAATLFHARAKLKAAAGLDAAALRQELERLSDDLVVELEETVVV